MSTNFPENVDNFPIIELPPGEAIKVFTAPGLLPQSWIGSPDVFVRHVGIPGHRQDLLADVKIVQVGGGGIGGWTAVNLLRSGSCAQLTVIENDRFDPSNGNRQLLYAGDIGEWKAFALARNLLPHAMRPTRLVAIALPFEKAIQAFELEADLLIVGVDNNAARFAGARFARERGIPAVFTMLSLTGMRMHCFLQGPGVKDACLHCAKPDMDPDRSMYCTPAIVHSCFAAAAQTTFFVHRALMGWPEGVTPYNWYTADFLSASAPARTGNVEQSANCPTCSPYRK